MMRGVGRALPSLARLAGSCSPSSLSSSGAARVSSLGIGSWDDRVSGDGRSDGVAGILAAWNPSFSRGFASDALSVKNDLDGLPPTVAAMKNPTHAITYDEHVHERFPPGDPSKKAFTYFLLTGGRFAAASALRLAVLKLILSMSASKDVLAMASLEVDLSNIEKGATVTVKWRGKPVFIRRRSEEDIKAALNVNLNELRDPQPDEVRVQKPEWLVVVGVCTHLGCVPLPNAGDYHGWFCPCHGSHYDTSGRVRKGPAPYNLEVPPYSFLEENKLLVG